MSVLKYYMHLLPNNFHATAILEVPPKHRCEAWSSKFCSLILEFYISWNNECSLSGFHFWAKWEGRYTSISNFLTSFFMVVLIDSVTYTHSDIVKVLEGKEWIFDFWQFLATGDVNKVEFIL